MCPPKPARTRNESLGKEALSGVAGYQCGKHRTHHTGPLAVRPAKVGHYVLARMPATGLGVGARPGDRIVKRVRAVAGDTVKVEGTELYINGKHQDNDRLWLAKSIPGKEPGDFDREVTLGDGELFLMGTTRESFDSRYWGPVKREAILGSAIPLF